MVYWIVPAGLGGSSMVVGSHLRTAVVNLDYRAQVHEDAVNDRPAPA